MEPLNSWAWLEAQMHREESLFCFFCLVSVFSFMLFITRRHLHYAELLKSQINKEERIFPNHHSNPCLMAILFEQNCEDAVCCIVSLSLSECV